MYSPWATCHVLKKHVHMHWHPLPLCLAYRNAVEAGLKAALERLQVTPPSVTPADAPPNDASPPSDTTMEAPPSDATPPSSAATSAATDHLEYVLLLWWSRMGTHAPPLLDQGKCVQVVHTRSKDKARKKNPPSPGVGEGEDEGPPVSSRTRGRSKVGESSSSGPHVQFVTPRIIQPSRLVQRPRMCRWRGHRLTRTHWMSMRHRKAL